eukprot:TCONS_00025735-protein
MDIEDNKDTYKTKNKTTDKDKKKDTETKNNKTNKNCKSWKKKNFKQNQKPYKNPTAAKQNKASLHRHYPARRTLVNSFPTNQPSTFNLQPPTICQSLPSFQQQQHPFFQTGIFNYQQPMYPVPFPAHLPVFSPVSYLFIPLIDFNFF